MIALRFDLEQMLSACVPGGHTCDPQRVADEIRAWFAAREAEFVHGAATYADQFREALSEPAPPIADPEEDGYLRGLRNALGFAEALADATQIADALRRHINDTIRNRKESAAVIVPAEPTSEMQCAGFESDAWDALGDAVMQKGGWPYSCRESAECVTAIYKAMLAAAPRGDASTRSGERMASPAGLLDRIKAAERRIADGHAPRRIPADPEDVDLVLAEVRAFLEGQPPPFWVPHESAPAAAADARISPVECDALIARANKLRLALVGLSRASDQALRGLCDAFGFADGLVDTTKRKEWAIVEVLEVLEDGITWNVTQALPDGRAVSTIVRADDAASAVRAANDLAGAAAEGGA